MNPVGIYFAFWEHEWNADFCKYIKKAKKLGFDGLELAAGPLSDRTEQACRSIADAAQEEGVALTYCLGLPRQYDVSSSDRCIREEGKAYVKELVKRIHHMGGTMLGGISYSCWPCSEASYDEKMRMRERSIASVRELAQTAQDYNVTLCLEVVNRFEQPIMNTAQEGVDYIREAGVENVKLLLDTFHMNIEEDSLYDAIVTAGELLGHFHIGECNRKTPGKGRMDWDTIAAGLRDAAYKGSVVMEPFLRPGGQVGRDIKIYRDQSGGASEEKMDVLAAEALEFIRHKL